MPPSAGLADRFFLFQETVDRPQHVGAIATFRLPADAEPDYVPELVRGFRDQRHVEPPFNYRLRAPSLSRLLPSYVELADDEVDLDYHFRNSTLPEPGGERELGVLISRLHSRALDLRRPLWEIHLIDGLAGGRFTIYFKVHHALMDGIGGVRKLQGMLTEDPHDTALRALWTIGPRRAPAAESGPALLDLAGLVRTAGGLARTAGGVARTAGGLARAGASLLGQGMRPADDGSATPYRLPPSRLNGRIGQQRRVATQAIEFERVQALADTAGVTINDVFLAICAGGLRRYLDELGDLPERGLIAGTPVSVRGGEGDDANNRFTMTVMRTYTDIDDPVERLQAIHDSSDETKRTLRDLPDPVAENYLALVMGPYVAQNLAGVAGYLKPPYNLIISNVPGPLEQQYLAGSELEAIYPFALLFHGMALFIAALTVSGKLALGFIGDRDRLPHLQRLAVYTGEAFDELERGYDAAPDPAPAPAPASAAAV